MNKMNRYSALFLMLFAAIFTSCEKEEDTDIPVISLSGNSTMVFETIGSTYNEPGASTNEGTLHIDYTSLHMDRRGESTIYYTAIDDADNVGHATRKIIVKNPAEAVIGSYNVEIKDVGNGNILDVYIDEITQDDYINGKFAFGNFDGLCGVDQPLYGTYEWNNHTVDVIGGQTFNGQGVANNTGNPFSATVNGSSVSFDMVINVGGAEKRYEYRKRLDPVETAMIKFAHIASDVLALDLIIDNNSKATAVVFRDNTNYISVDAWNRSVKLNSSANACFTQYSNITSFNPNNNYTLFLVGNQANNNVEILTLGDDLSTPPGGQARVRFLHGADGVNNVDIINIADSTVFFGNQAFKQNTTSNINQGTYTLRMVDAGTFNQVPNSIDQTVNFSDGKVYSLFSWRDNANGVIGLKTISNN